MKLLLDTHILVWALSADERLSPQIRDAIRDDRNEVYVSAISIWEIGVKHSLGRGQAPPFGADEAIAASEQIGFELIPVTHRQAAAASRLDPLHGDPFDRLLVAQALEAPYRLITRDAQVARYSDTIILMR